MSELLKFGLIPALLITIIILIVQKPERATQIKALITEPFYKFFRWFSREHISSKVTSYANEFLNSSIFSKLTHSERYALKVRWVSQPDDPILSQNGTLILRLKEEDDQTRNILSAVHAALPHVICPLIRTNINATCEKSIDLTVLKKLSEQLGKHGKITFKKYFLTPETDNDIHINALINKLVALDKYGFFIPIFLNELELLSEGLYSDNDTTDYSVQVLQFIEYLLTIVNREIGSEIELEYLVPPFKVSTIMLARASRADTQGLKPYLNRLRINLDKGSDSIYIVAFPPAFDFFDRLMKVLDSHERVFINNSLKTHHTLNGDGHQSNLKIGILSRNDIFMDKESEQRLITNNVHEGSRVIGIVEDISMDHTLVTILGMRSYISKGDCSWRSVANCADILMVGSEYEFIVKKIDKSTNQILLSLKLPELNPWTLVDLPKTGDTINVELLRFDSIKYNCLYQNRLEVFILISEISWYPLSHNQLETLAATTRDVKVIEIDEENEKIFCSLRQTESNPWVNIHTSLPVGTEFNAKVTEITHDYIQVKLPNNLYGEIPREALAKAGFEYVNFEENVVVGQGIEVVISKVFIARKRIRLDLKRNTK